MTDKPQIVVGFGAPDYPGGAPTVIIGIHPAAYDAMADTMTQTIDATKVGIRCQIMLFRGDSYDHVVELMQAGAAAAGAPFNDMRGKAGELPNLGIDEPTKQ